MFDLVKIKHESEQYVLSHGGSICDWLPSIGPEEIALRESKEIAARALVLNILVHISFGAPIAVASRWLQENDVLSVLTESEKNLLLAKSEPKEKMKNQLRWNIESLWSAAWVGSFADDLTPVQDISDSLASWFPDLRTNEPAEGFLAKFNLRGKEQLYQKLDLFYRAHWHARNSQLSGKDSSPFHLGVVQQRRHFLEWALHAETEWDDVDLST